MTSPVDVKSQNQTPARRGSPTSSDIGFEVAGGRDAISVDDAGMTPAVAGAAVLVGVALEPIAADPHPASRTDPTSIVATTPGRVIIIRRPLHLLGGRIALLLTVVRLPARSSGMNRDRARLNARRGWC